MDDFLDQLDDDWWANRYDEDYDVHEEVKNEQKRLNAFGHNNPSKEKECFWIYAERFHNDYPESTPRSGKWLVFAKQNEIDKLWETIKQATKSGVLGNDAKVSTAAKGKTEHVICVYTYDWKHRKDVMRIREELRKLGITKKIPYKTNADTLAGVYAKQGERISKYWE